MVDAVRTEPGLAAGQLGPPGKAIEAGSLQGWDWAGAQSAPPPKIGLDPQTRAGVVASVVGKVLQADPKLLNFTPADLAFRSGLPVAEINKSLGDLAQLSGVSLTKADGKAKTLGEFLGEVPSGAGLAPFKQWFSRQPPAVQAAITGAALGAVLNKTGLPGLAQLGLKYEVVKDPNGKLFFAVAPDTRAQPAGQVGGALTIPLGPDNRLDLSASANTSADRAFLAGLALGLGGSSQAKLSVGVSNGARTVEATVQQGGISASYSGSPQSQTWGVGVKLGPDQTVTATGTVQKNGSWAAGVEFRSPLP